MVSQWLFLKLLKYIFWEPKSVCIDIITTEYLFVRYSIRKYSVQVYYGVHLIQYIQPNNYLLQARVYTADRDMNRLVPLLILGTGPDWRSLLPYVAAYHK